MLFRLRFSVRTMLVAVGLLTLATGRFVNSAERQREAGEHVLMRGGSVGYSFNRLPDARRPPAWVMRPPVRDHVYAARHLEFCSFRDESNPDDDPGYDFAVLRDLPSLTELRFTGNRFDDETLRGLRVPNGLQTIFFVDTRVTRAAVERLAASMHGCRVYAFPIGPHAEVYDSASDRPGDASLASSE